MLSCCLPQIIILQTKMLQQKPDQNRTIKDWPILVSLCTMWPQFPVLNCHSAVVFCCTFVPHSDARFEQVLLAISTCGNTSSWCHVAVFVLSWTGVPNKVVNGHISLRIWHKCLSECGRLQNIADTLPTLSSWPVYRDSMISDFKPWKKCYSVNKPSPKGN